MYCRHCDTSPLQKSFLIGIVKIRLRSFASDLQLPPLIKRQYFGPNMGINKTKFNCICQQ